jgi:hypothetical protein
MPGEQSEREETRPAVPASVHGPVTLDSAHTVSSPSLQKEEEQGAVPREEAILTAAHAPDRDPTSSQGIGIMPTLIPRRRRRPFFILSSVVILLLVLIFFITDVGHITSAPATAHQKTPTATAVLTATPTAIPTPTTRSGFQNFIDTTDGFLVQYPVGWTHRLSNPGAEFTDDAVNTTFEMQVLLPSDSAAAGLSGNPNDPTSWVNFAMQSFATQYARDFKQDAGPLPAATFAGATWQTARGLISDQMSQVSIQVQVYATIYQGKPYIISLYAAAGVFSLADKVYFQPMLQSFEFLSVAA